MLPIYTAGPDALPSKLRQPLGIIQMKKSLLALAVLGAIAGTASAQSSVTIYGIADAGLSFEGGAPKAAPGVAVGDSVTKLSSGIESGSRLGFKGTEDLGGGLSAKFQLETGIAIDAGGFTQGGTAFGRQAWVGLSGNFGNLSLGRQYTPLFIAGDTIDPFDMGLAGTASNLMKVGGAQSARMNNAVNYTTNNLSGFVGTFAYGFGEVSGNNSASRQWGASGTYSQGPLTVLLAYHNWNDAAAAVAGADIGNHKTTLIGGSYDFTAAKAYVGYAFNKADNGLVESENTRDFLLGVSVPFGQSTFLASYIKKTDKSALGVSPGASQIAVGYQYALSKRTDLYTSYGHINNDTGAAYTVGNAIDGGLGNRAFNFGIRHKF